MGSGRARVDLRESTWRALADRLGTFLFTIDLKERHLRPKENKVLKDLEKLTSPCTSAGFRYLRRRAKKTTCLSTLILPSPS
ncbi:hypothetical protein CapIbe_001537 [Capra ibex]